MTLSARNIHYRLSCSYLAPWNIYIRILNPGQIIRAGLSTLLITLRHIFIIFVGTDSFAIITFFPRISLMQFLLNLLTYAKCFICLAITVCHSVTENRWLSKNAFVLFRFTLSTLIAGPRLELSYSHSRPSFYFCSTWLFWVHNTCMHQLNHHRFIVTAWVFSPSLHSLSDGRHQIPSVVVAVAVHYHSTMENAACVPWILILG